MSKISVRFEFPGNPPIKKFISSLAEAFPLQLTSQHYAVKTFYDSFDWRLYNANLLCEFNQSKSYSYLNLIDRESGQIMTRINLEKVPAFISELGDNRLSQQLLPLLEMRALLPIVSLNLQLYQINILNKDEKTVARLTIEAYEDLSHRLTLKPIKGYDKASEKLTELLLNSMGLEKLKQPLLIAALKNQGRKPGDYSSKLNLKLEPNLSAHQAVKTIYATLLQTMKLNEQGTINAIDTEFLHDFRVAIRRTRAGLSQLKAALPADISNRYSQHFAWLGQITSAARDLDVYLLNFSAYQTGLPAEMQADLLPLRDFLQRKQAAAQQQLGKYLRSKKYLAPLIAWEQYLKLPAEKSTNAEVFELSVKQLADLRIWKVYQRIIKQGSAITEQSPATALHELRKTCKKLRYLIEFFQSLYPPAEIKALIKNLKELQELLGDFQDCAVQELTLKHFSEEMLDSGCSQQTFMAIEKLIQVLNAKSSKARADFSGCFSVFAAAENRSVFKALFSPNV